MLGVDPVAAYAAIVATGALALEIRRWFESGARLRIRLIAPAKLIGGALGAEEKEYIAITVANVGAIPTTITHFVLHDYKTWINEIRNHADFSAIVPKPWLNGYEPGIPKLLNPGEEWSGMAVFTSELKEKAANGRLYVGVAYSHSKRSKLVKIPTSRDGSRQ